MKTNLLKLLCIIVILVLLIIVCFVKKEHFSSGEISDGGSFKLIDREGGRVLNEFSNFQGFEIVIDPNDPNKKMKCRKFANDSSIVYSRKDVSTDSDFTIGFYFKADSDSSPYNYLFSAEDDNETEVMRIDLKNDSINIHYEDNDLSIPKESNLVSNDDTEFSYLVLKGDLKNKDFIPKLTIFYNSKKYEITLSNKEAQELTMRKFIFGNKKLETMGFVGLIGKIMVANEVLGQNKICSMYNCGLVCFEPDGSKTYDGNVNNCIQDCMSTCENIEKCQKICINCEVEGKYWDNETKMEKCPWLKDIKILEQNVPEPPIIRGFPGDRKILVEWKKPFDGRSEITNYIVLYYESFNKKNGINVSISGKSDLDILEYQISNLKNKTYYDVEIRAVNSVGIGKPSNIISVAPNGNIVTNNNRNIFSELEEDLQKEVDNMEMDFMCNVHNFDSIGHTLDYFDEDMSDIKSYIEDLNKGKKN